LYLLKFNVLVCVTEGKFMKKFCLPDHSCLKNITYLFTFLIFFTSINAQEEYESEPFWSRIPGLSSDEVTKLEITDSDHIYASVWGSGIHKSIDYGANWQNLTGNLPNKYINCIEVVGSGVYVGTYGDGVFYSNGSGTWENRSNGITNMVVKALIAYGGKIYAGTQGSGIFVSTDNGMSWEQSIEGMWFLDINDLFVGSNGDILVATNGGGAYRSTNAGESWKVSSAGLTNKTVTCFAKNTTGAILCGTMGGGVYETVNDGASWVQFNANYMPYYISDIEMITSQNPIVATYDIGLWYYDWLSTDWQESDLTTFGVNSIVKDSRGHFFASLPYRGIMESTNSGASWRNVAFLNNAGLNTLEAFKGGYVFAVNYRDEFVMSEDHGISWKSLNIPNASEVHSYGMDSTGFFYACTDAGLFVSPDNGDIWLNFGLSDEVILSVAIDSDGIMYAGCLPDIPPVENPPPAPVLYRSTDNGTTWEMIYEGYVSAVMLVVGHQNELYMLTSNELWVSNDNGDSFDVADGVNPTSLGLTTTGNAVASTANGNYHSSDQGATWNPLFIDPRGTFFMQVTQKNKLHYYKRHDSSFKHVGMIKNQYRSSTYDTVNTGFTRATITDLSYSPDGFIYLANSSYYRAIDAEEIGVPTLITPDVEAKGLGLNPTFVWSKVDNAVLYEFQISQYQDFEGYVESVVLSDTTRTLIKPLEFSKSYFWRVRGKTNRSHGKWSTVRIISTKIEAPLLATPDSASGGYPLELTLSWHPVDKADGYHIEVSESDDFSSILEKATVQDDTTFALTGLEISKRYYWRVKTYRGEIESDWSNVWFFRTLIGSPALRLPENESINHMIDELTMEWEALDGAEHYWLQVANDELFENMVLDTNNLTIAQFKAIDTLEHYRNYYWRVKAVDEYGESDWSEVWVYTTIIGPAQLASPSNTAVDIDPEEVRFLWGRFTDATAYRLQVATDKNMENIVYDDDKIFDNKLSLFDLDYFEKYYWRVRIRSFDHIGLWSGVWEFTTGIQQPQLTAPDSNSTDNELDVYLQWESVLGSDKYEVLLSTDSEFSTTILEDDDVKVNFLITEGLEYDTEYFWKVRGVYQYGNGPWSEVWNFRTKEDHSSVGSICESQFIEVTPNPFSEQINVKYHIEKPSEVQIEIFDMSGFKVLSEGSELKQSGSHEFSWKPDDVSDGTYYISIRINGISHLKKVVYISK
jgi:photosystem II stability/assembly factor-like uncharacterized protein